MPNREKKFAADRSVKNSPTSRMGVNGQKRKNKQGPVPSLEESLPKKFKSSKFEKSKKSRNGVKTKVVAKPAKKPVEKPKAKILTPDPVEENGDDEREFGAAKASLFDDEDEEEDVFDEFEGLDGEVDMYHA
jgi:hypothetical protein